MSDWFVYIISNNAHTLYVGATNNLPKRIHEHKTGAYESSFTARYTFDRCVYFEHVGPQASAIEREQQIKRWSRRKKIALIERLNPWWDDLSARFSLDALFS
jgi:putative endonuclease